MKKRFLLLFSMIIFCFWTTVPIYAQEIPDQRLLPRLVDQADLLSAQEEETLLAQLDEISNSLECDVVVVTANSLEGKSAKDYADDFYDYNGYGFGTNKDGVLLLVSMESRDWWISTTGFCISALTDAIQANISDQFLPKLSDGKYAESFSLFASLCEKYISQAITPDTGASTTPDTGTSTTPDTGASITPGTGMPSTSTIDGSLSNQKTPPSILWLPFSFIIGLVISLIVLGFMRAALKTVHPQDSARNYLVSGSFHLTKSKDLFLYQQTSRRAKPQNTNSGGGKSKTHISSSGTRHGGGGGKF